MRVARALAAGAFFLAACACAATPEKGVLPFSPEEIEDILRHGPWPPPESRDASNRVSGKREAVEFGARLFFDPRLSTAGNICLLELSRPRIRVERPARARRWYRGN